MATILVDYENVVGTNGLKGVDALQNDDVFIIFYSSCCGKIRNEYMQEIKKSGCEFRIIKLKGTGKNALDFYIATECGIASEKGEKQLAIISNDKGYQAVMDFFEVRKTVQDIQDHKGGQRGNSPDDAGGCGKCRSKGKIAETDGNGRTGNGICQMGEKGGTAREKNYEKSNSYFIRKRDFA